MCRYFKCCSRQHGKQCNAMRKMLLTSSQYLFPQILLKKRSARLKLQTHAEAPRGDQRAKHLATRKCNPRKKMSHTTPVPCKTAADSRPHYVREGIIILRQDLRLEGQTRVRWRGYPSSPIQSKRDLSSEMRKWDGHSGFLSSSACMASCLISNTPQQCRRDANEGRGSVSRQ